MNETEALQDLALIRKMINKSKRGTADSGYFLIFIGILCMITTLVIGLQESYPLNHLVLPAMIVTLIGGAGIGILTTNTKGLKEKVSSYHKRICYSIWCACAVPVLLITFVFPYTGIIQSSLITVLSSLSMGIDVFALGILFETQFVLLSSLVWWIGALLMAFLDPHFLMYIMMTVIFLGWVLPGLILNQSYKKQRTNRDR